MVAEIIIDSSVKTLNRTFDYEIPEDLKIEIGDRVFVPFGNKKSLEDGVVVGLKETSEFKIKPIASIQEKSAVNKNSIEIARWMANRYFCNISDCLRLMLTPGTTTKNISNRVKEKTIRTVSLALDTDEVEYAIENKKIKSEKQKNVLEFLINNEVATIQDIELFTDASEAVVKTLIKNGYVEESRQKVERNPFLHHTDVKTVDLKLTNEQKNAFNKILGYINKKEKIPDECNKFLINGITGSGKTEIYLQLIEVMINKGNTSIVLVPEISLTPQTVSRFVERFGEDTIAVLHSKLSVGERFDQWNKIKEGRAKIVIGARSAIFAPVQNLGLIIIDEEHDESYKSEKSPRYSAVELSEFIANMYSIPLVLGSATPDINTYYKAKNGQYELLKLTKRANNSSLPKVEIIDLRQELAKGNKSMISDRLKEQIQINLDTGKQTILFLNRRGFSTFVMCRDCGHTIKCKRCNITLTYHKYENKLKCHYCGYEQDVVKECPECHSKNIKYFGAGTQKLEDEIKKMFPTATTIRMDVDTVSKKNSHEEILNKFKEENINILIGTQMVVKGHHFPNVTLVGVIAADSSLNIGDFRSSERTFQTLTQVAGRAGREKDEGRVIVQTYNPDNYAIEYSKTQNYDLFYDTEIEIRKALKYPPFCDIIVIDMSSHDLRELSLTAKKLHIYLKNRIINEKIPILLYSPVPSPIDRIKNKHRWRMIIKCKYDDRVRELLNGMNVEFYGFKNNSTRVAIEVNPNNML